MSQIISKLSHNWPLLLLLLLLMLMLLLQLLCSSLQFLAARGSAAQVSSVCTLFLTVLNILPILHPTVSRMCKMNGGNKQRKLAEHLQIPAAYLLIGLHLLKNFGQLASS